MLLPALLPCLLAAPPEQPRTGTAAEELDAPACAAGRSDTRWQPGSGGYDETASFGDSDGQWIVGVGGLASDGNEVLLYDRGRPQLLVLTADLELVREVGREGDGPGEFRRVTLPYSVPPIWDFGFVAGNSQGSVVFDSQHFELFDVTGAATQTVSGWSSGPFFGGGVRYVAMDSNAGPMFAVDSINVRGGGRRTFQTWRLTEEGAEKVWELRLPDVPRLGASGFVMPARQARARWALFGPCIVVNDGESQYVQVFDQLSSKSDSIELPEWNVQEIANDDRSPGIRGRAGRTVTNGGQLPTAVARWMNMSVDPDGHVWIEPWQAEQDGSSSPFVVSLLTGQVSRVSVPAFPIAFGEPGVFYGIVEDTTTDEAAVKRFDLR